MNIIMLGDVVGRPGCQAIRRTVPLLRKQYSADLIITNGENAAEGNGILPASADDLFDSGVDIITLGNHGLRRREIWDYLDSHDQIIRPANLHPSAPGLGWTVFDRPGKPKAAVINLVGSCYMDLQRNIFDCMDELLTQIDAPIILVDLHAEATSEKLSFAFDFDSRISAVVGTHTHIQTADERILPGGTGYLTDLGMCGSFNSVLGVRAELAIRRFRTGLPTRFENDKGPVRVSGVFLQINDADGRTTRIERINVDLS